MKKFLVIFLLVVTAGFLSRGSPSVVQNSDERAGVVTTIENVESGMIVVSSENPSTNSAVITRDATDATQNQANISQLNNEGMISIPREIEVKGLQNTENGMLTGTDGQGPPVAVSSNLFSGNVATDLKKLDAAEVEYTSTAELILQNSDSHEDPEVLVGHKT